MRNTDKITLATAAAAVALVASLAACGGEVKPASNSQASDASTATEFASLEAARQAVHKVIGCDETPTTEPIVNPDLAGHTAEYSVCADRVQVEWFQTEDARNAEQQLYADSSQPLALVEGKNWMVVDLSKALQEPASGRDLKNLAEQLGGQYRSINGA
ncbi:hypothetical protein [Paenarthrobacter sp. AMU7]|uniref:Lipoprotein n=1 Tax=Paenarthrobacter sp. AMU7 TaxID=3162492 RepID=A0AB39YP97_9MICC